MALTDFISLADEKLHEVFSRKPHDASKARNAMIKRLDKAHEQFKSTEPARGRKLFKIQNGIVELALPFEVGGKSVFHLPTERFADAIQHLKESILNGELDDELKGSAAHAGTAGTGRKSAAGGGWSDERRARFAATVAARKVAKSK